MTLSNSVFIYNGQGASPTCVEQTIQALKSKYDQNYSIIEIDGSYLARESQPRLYVLPGGSAGLMGRELQQAATKIQNCVQQGSGMLAFCAGTLVASSGWEYFVPTTKIPFKAGCSSQSRFCLNLGPTAFGPPFFDEVHTAQEYLGDDTIAQTAEIYLPTDQKSFTSFWNRGPIFNASPSHTVLAQYTSPTNSLIDEETPAAAIHTTYGEGSIVFVSFHPELAQWSKNKGYPLYNHNLASNDNFLETSCTLAGLSIKNI